VENAAPNSWLLGCSGAACFDRIADRRAMGLACTDDLLARLAADMGLPDKTRLVRRVDIASYPRPDGDTGGEGLGAMCGLGGAAGPPSSRPTAV
jgi:hypothetical protein